MCGAVFRDGDRAGVEIEVVFAERLPRGHVRVAVQEDIAGAERRQMRSVIDVAVRGVDQAASGQENAVIGKDREGQHHLVDLRVAVAAHAEEAFAPLVEHGQHLLGRVFIRQIVARAVVENVAQQQKPIGPFPVKRGQQFAAVPRRAVDIRCDHELHKTPPQPFARSFTTSPAMISPATDGTKAVLPGISRRSVHLCFAPGGQMQWLRQLMDISSMGLVGISSE